ncbi:MAG: helix-turn-helix transcriptional regulator [Oscillospiraceae bacterium]
MKDVKSVEAQAENSNAQKIRRIYQESGLTYDEMSEITKIKRNTLACWISLRRNPPNHALELIKMKMNGLKMISSEENENTESSEKNNGVHKTVETPLFDEEGNPLLSRWKQAMQNSSPCGLAMQ